MNGIMSEKKCLLSYCWKKSFVQLVEFCLGLFLIQSNKVVTGLLKIIYKKSLGYYDTANLNWL